jgi:hypothetical protein
MWSIVPMNIPVRVNSATGPTRRAIPKSRILLHIDRIERGSRQGEASMFVVAMKTQTSFG